MDPLFHQKLDRYLTTPPEDEWQELYEDVAEYLSEEMWAEAEDWFLESDQAHKWMMKLAEKYPRPFRYEKDREQKMIDAINKIASVIERAYWFHKIDPTKSK